MPSVDLMPTTVIRVARLLLRMGVMIVNNFHFKQLLMAFYASISVASSSMLIDFYYNIVVKEKKLLSFLAPPMIP
jgi:hypothetical protein